MKITKSKAAVGAAVAAAAGLAGAAAAGVITVRRWRRGPDPARDENFSEPPDTIHRTVPARDGGEVHFVVRGEGRPFLLVHGVTNSTEVWNQQLTDLVDAGFLVVAVDLRGHGRSRAGSHGHTIEAMANDVFRVIRALDLRQAVAVGHSMGGMVLLQLLADYPELQDGRVVTGLVLVATSASPVLGNGLPAAAADLVRFLTPVAGRSHARATASRVPRGLPPGDLALLYCRLAFGSHASPTHVERLRAMTSATPPAILGEMLQTLVHLDVRHTLHLVRIPALVVVGARDLLTPVWHARYLANHLPVAGLIVLPGSGHLVMFERRAELARLLTDFAGRTQPVAEPTLVGAPPP